MWYDHIPSTGVDKTRTLNTAELDNNLMYIMGLKEKSALKRTYNWLDDNYQFSPEENWPYWKHKS